MSDVPLVIATIFAPLMLILSGIGFVILVVVSFLDAVSEIFS